MKKKWTNKYSYARDFVEGKSNINSKRTPIETLLFFSKSRIRYDATSNQLTHYWPLEYLHKLM